MPAAANARFDDAARHDALAALPHWQHDPARDAIRRRSTFADFTEAYAFMTRVALAAERLGHHPEWCNVHDRVDVVLTTHDVGRLSPLDVALAQAADAACAACGQPAIGRAA